MTEPAVPPPIVPAEDVARRYALEERRMNLEAGWLGSIFGSRTPPSTSIAGIVLILLILMNFILIFSPSAGITAGEFAKQILLPIITLVFGYLFGKKTGEE